MGILLNAHSHSHMHIKWHQVTQYYRSQQLADVAPILQARKIPVILFVFLLFVCFQIYLLAASPNSAVTAVFRIHLNYLNGPLLAFIFPETDSRIVSIYFIFYIYM